MSSIAEFKEKTFEKYFGYELARQTSVTFSPDQCDEAFLGFDDAFLVDPRILALFLPHMRQRRWQRLSGIDIRHADGLAEEISGRMPPLKFNLFVQYKRPEYIDHHRGKEWPCWRASYFRFDITPHQQKLLADLEAQAVGRASVVYASAAFWKNSDLYSHAQTGMVIENSNIASVARLIGHGRFSYQRPGSFGRGHSDPVEIESRSLAQIIEEGLQQEELPLNRHVKRIARNIDRVTASDEGQAEMIDSARRLLLGDYAGLTPGGSFDSFTYAFATIAAFCELADVSFHAIG